MENSKNMEADKAKASTNNFLILKKEDAEDTPNPYAEDFYLFHW